MDATSVTFSPSAIARAKLLVVGPAGALRQRMADGVRSLKETDYISAEELFRSEAGKNPSAGSAVRRVLATGRALPDAVACGRVRHWFWSRKPARGFVLGGFPATRAQAIVFDEWLDARDESLTACVALAGAETNGVGAAVSRHYEQQGLLVRAGAEFLSDLDQVVAGLFERLGRLVADR